MNKNIMALYDEDRAYMERFIEFIHMRRQIPFEVRAFTSGESLASFAKKEEIDLLLVSGDCLTQQVRQIRAGCLIVLSEEEFAEDTGEKKIYKYQSAENIVREIMFYYASKQPEQADMMCIRSETRLIGVYSPVRRSLKTSFALTLGMMMSEKEPVLYINMEEYAGFSTLFAKEYTGDLSDLIYFLKQGEKNILFKLKSMVCSANGLDYIPPSVCSYDLRSVEAKEWLDFIRAVARGSEYAAIILDIGESIQGLYEILEKCDVIYTPVREDKISQAKIYQYEKLLQMMDYPVILDRTRKLKFSYFRGMEMGLENLLYSELGGYVRELLREESDGRYEKGKKE